MPLPRHALFASAGTLLLAATLAACSGSAGAASSTTTADGRTVLRYQGWPSDVGYPELAADLGYFDDISLEWIGDVTSGPAAVQATVAGDTDFGGAFNGAIVNLAAGGAPVTAVISYYGSDHATEGGFFTLEGSPIRQARDLIGKKIGVNTLGGQSEAVIGEYLQRAGLTEDETAQVSLVVVPPVNAEQLLREGQIDVAALSDVVQDKALERGGITRLFGETDLFGEQAYGTLIFRDDFIAAHPDAVADFVQGTARAIRWAQTTPVDEVRARLTTIIDERAHTGETSDLVPYWKSSSVPTAGGVIQPEEFQIWIDWLTKDGQIGPGSVNLESLFTNEYNPYANGTYAPDAGPDGAAVEAAPPATSSPSEEAAG